MTNHHVNHLFLLAGVLVLTLPGVFSALNDDTRAYWSFDTNSTLGKDLVNSYNLTAHNNVAGSTAQYKITQSAYFDGTSDYFTGARAIIQNTDMSISAWVYPISITTDGGYVRRIMNKGGTNADFRLSVGTDGKVLFDIKDSTNSWKYVYCQGQRVVINTWTHIVVSLDRSANKIYINGSECSDYEYQNTWTNFKDTDIGVYIGTYDGSNGDWYGYIDELAVFTKALNSSEVTYLYDSGSPDAEQQHPFSAANTAPYGSITYPANGSTVYWNGSLVMSFTDDESDSYLCNVTMSATNNTYTWYNLSSSQTLTGTRKHNRNYTITSSCSDGEDSSQRSSWFYFENKPPTVQMIYPVNTTRYGYGQWNNSFSYYVQDEDLDPNTDELQFRVIVYGVTYSGTHTIAFNPPFNKTVVNTVPAIAGPVNISWAIMLTDKLGDTFQDEYSLLTGWVYYDNVFPEVFGLYPANGSEISKNSTSAFNFTANVFDNWLYRVNVTIFNPDNSTYWNNYSGDISSPVEWWNVTKWFNVTGAQLGVYRVEIDAADSHTAAVFSESPRIRETMTKEGYKETVYEMDYGDISFTYEKEIKLVEVYEKDRIVQEFDLTAAKTAQYTIKADKIIEIKDSIWPCHVIINDKYWYDCDGLPGASLKKTGDNEYMVLFENTGEIVKSRSLGGLNEIEYRSWFEISEIPAFSGGSKWVEFRLLRNNTLQTELIEGANVVIYANHYGSYLLQSNTTTDEWGKTGFNASDTANYTLEISHPDYEFKNITIGTLVYSSYDIFMEGTTMDMVLMGLLGVLSFSMFMFSFWAQRISVSFISAALMVGFGLLIWPVSLIFGISFVLGAVYNMIQIVL